MQIQCKNAENNFCQFWDPEWLYPTALYWLEKNFSAVLIFFYAVQPTEVIKPSKMFMMVTEFRNFLRL